MAQVATYATVPESAVCPSCYIVSTLINISERDAALVTMRNMIPAGTVGEVMRKAKCILCTAAEVPSIRVQEAAAGHIWFLIGDSVDEIPPQAALNQHFWTAIANSSRRQRAAARNQLLELVASSAFGCLHLPHLAISVEERTWLMGEMQKGLGDDAGSALGAEAVQAFIDQFGVPLIINKRNPTPDWATKVRFIPTPEGVEAYRMHFLSQGQGQGPDPIPHPHSS